MDNYSSSQPLVLSVNADVKKKSPIVLALKWSFKATMWLIFISWLALLFLYPTSFGATFFQSLVTATSGTIFAPSGGTFVLMSVPVLVIAILSVPYLIIRDEPNFLKKRSSKKANISLSTFPLLVGGVFGVVSAAEFIGIFLFYFYAVWAVCTNLSPREESIAMLESEGKVIASSGLVCLVFLFLPITRGSILLRLINIPFEHATRYHIWLGHLMLFLFTVHGICFLTGWSLDGTLHYQILDWKDAGVQNFAGVMALLMGLVIWVTSLGFVRKWSFELFYYTHHLYVVFIVLFALHVGDYYVSMAAAGIFLFMLDRFLRFCQSRKTVGVISARSFPCGAVELVLSKPKNLSYSALSFIFIQIPEISRLQWHPFSVSSSPLDGKNHLSILIKTLGNWTQKLSRAIDDDEEQGPKIMLKACVEGPYGHQVPYHLEYENLILIAGGIGISPFLAILSDILHRVEEDKLCLSRNIIVIWAVRTSDEIPLLSAISLDSFPPSCFLKLDLSINIYVTRQQNPHLEEGAGDHKTLSNPKKNKANGISVLVGSGNILWSGTYVIVSILGLLIPLALFDGLYMSLHHIASVHRGFVVLGFSVAAVLLFGGCVIGFWHFQEIETLDNEESTDNENGMVQNLCESNRPTLSHTVTEYGSRPDFKEILGVASKRWGHVDVGVIVCGPSSLESSVAREIRTHNLTRETNHSVFHFHSHSFQL